MKKKDSKQIPEFVMFHSETLKAIMEGRVKDVESRSGGWQGPFSIFVTLCATYVVSDFKDRFGLTAGQWEVVAIVAMLLSAIWTIVGGSKFFFRPSVKDLLHNLYDVSLTKQSRRIVFIFKAKSSGGVTKLLVYRDPVWQCYLLPNIRRSEVPDDDSKLAQLLYDRFGGGSRDCFNAINVPDFEFVSHKISQRSGKYTMYTFDFFCVVVCERLGDLFSSRSFKVGNGISYEWLSLDELYADPMTLARNRDILDFLAENSGELLGGEAPLSINMPIGD